MLETVICLICPLPFYEVMFPISQYVVGKADPLSADYLVSDFILIFMFLRFYLVLRNVFNFSEFTDPYAKLHCERHGFTAGTRFSFK